MSKNKLTFRNGRTICKCGTDLGPLKDSKWYYCQKCKFIWLTAENALKEYEKVLEKHPELRFPEKEEKKEKQKSVLDWIKKLQKI